MARKWLSALSAGIFCVSPTVGTLDAPYSGAAFLKQNTLQTLPSRELDEGDPNVRVQRLLPNEQNKKSADACNGGDAALETPCLHKPGRECMWARVESRNPLLPIQEVHSYCLPCMIDEEEIPCWNVGGWVGGKIVTDCVMSCPHQKRIRQPEYTCSDETGFISQSQCFDKGTRSGSKCMFIGYTDKDGQAKSSCGPCSVEGTGGWGCPATGAKGPADDSEVSSCLSQCDVICSGPPGCPPTVAPPPPLPPPSPGIVGVNAEPSDMLLAPAPYAMPTVNPYAIAQAAMEAAKKAGWAIGTPPPPKVYYPVVMYRSPSDYAFTPLPPPNMAPIPQLPVMMLQGQQESADDRGPPEPRHLQHWGIEVN